MSWLDTIKEQKASREKYEKGAIRLKELIVDMEILHNKHNGNFIADLENFINNYKNKNNA